jgi:hypothetical protein
MGFADEGHRIIRSSIATWPTFSVRPAYWPWPNSPSSASTGNSTTASTMTVAEDRRRLR